MSTKDYDLTGDEEIVARPKGKEYTTQEEETAKQEMTFYGSSEWCKMVADWQKTHPVVSKTYTKEEIEESDKVIKEANEDWRKIKEERENTRIQALERIKSG